MTGHFRFETLEVETPTVGAVRQALQSNRGALVVGPLGSGKAHAVARAVADDAIWVTVPDRPFAVPRVLADLSAQLGGADDVLPTYLEAGPADACKKLEARLGNRALVVRSFERLFPPPMAQTDIDATNLWSGELASLGNWIEDRMSTAPTFALARGRRPTKKTVRTIHHPRLASWPVKLMYSSGGFPDWTLVAERLEGAPAAAFHLAAAATRFAGAERMLWWLRETEDDGHGQDVLRKLSSIVVAHAPKQLLRVLSLLSAAGELARTLVADLGRADPDIDVGVEVGLRSGLIEKRAGVLRVAPLIEDLAVLPSPDEVGAHRLLERAVQLLLSRVNDRSALEPDSARAVLDAHRLQLTLKDFDGALTTARLHVGGLVAYAKSLGMAAQQPEEFDRARKAYAEIERLIGEPAADQHNIAAYVTHYHGYNGYRADTLGLDRVAECYASSVSRWRENALFHARRIALAAERGRTPEATAFYDQARSAVPDHDRKDAYLRVRAAFWAHVAGAPLFGVRHLESYTAPEWLADVDPTAYSCLARLLDDWREGIAIKELHLSLGRELVFTRPTTLRIERAHDAAWVAHMDYPPARAEDAGPWSATMALAERLVERCLRLVTQPTARLARREVAEKGLFIGAIDLGLSEIGLPHHTSRWLLGQVVGDHFVPQHDLPPLPIGEALSHDGDGGLYFARVPVGRAGLPTGRIEKLIPAGSGRSVAELVEMLHRLARDDDAA